MTPIEPKKEPEMEIVASASTNKRFEYSTTSTTDLPPTVYRTVAYWEDWRIVVPVNGGNPRLFHKNDLQAWKDGAQ